MELQELCMCLSARYCLIEIYERYALILNSESCVHTSDASCQNIHHDILAYAHWLFHHLKKLNFTQTQ